MRWQIEKLEHDLLNSTNRHVSPKKEEPNLDLQVIQYVYEDMNESIVNENSKLRGVIAKLIARNFKSKEEVMREINDGPVHKTLDEVVSEVLR